MLGAVDVDFVLRLGVSVMLLNSKYFDQIPSQHLYTDIHYSYSILNQSTTFFLQIYAGSPRLAERRLVSTCALGGRFKQLPSGWASSHWTVSLLLSVNRPFQNTISSNLELGYSISRY